MGVLRDVVETRRAAGFEMMYPSTDREVHLKGSASPMDDLVFATFVDVTELKERESSFRLLFEANPVPTWVMDAETMSFLDVNEAAVTHYGYPRAQFLAMSHFNLLPSDERDALRVLALDRASKPSYAGDRSWRHLRADGSEIRVILYARPLLIGQRQATLVACIDVTSQQVAADELRRTRAFLNTIVENVPSALFVKDAADSRFVLLNRAGEDVLGLPRDEVIGRTTAEVLPAEFAAALDEQERDVVSAARGHLATTERPYPTRHNGTRLLNVRKMAIRDDDGTVRFLLDIAEDVTEQRAVESRIAHMAHHDLLTDLPNRTLFGERLALSLARQRGHGGLLAVLCLDLDDFKLVNDTLGHPAGDELLKQAARRLRQCVREEDTVARLGGDEFAVLQVAPASAEEVSVLVARIVRSIAVPFAILGQELRVGISVGIALAPNDGTEPDLLMRNADLALYQAKAGGKSTYRFFESSTDARLRSRRALEHELNTTVGFAR